MRPPEADADLLVRSAVRCAALAVQLSAIESTLDGVAGDHGVRWSGTAAAVFRTGVADHRRSVADTRRTVEHLAGLIRAFGHEVADAQTRARSAGHHEGARSVAEDELAPARVRFRRQLQSVESALNQIRLRLVLPSGRWTGPVRPPASLQRGRLPVPPPGRWTGPVRPPESLQRGRLPLPAPALASPVRAPMAAVAPS